MIDGVKVLEENFTLVLVIVGVVSLLLGYLYISTKKRIWFIIEVFIILTLVFFIYDVGTNFNTVLILGLVSLVTFFLGFGIFYLYKKYIKKEEVNFKN